MSTVVSGYKNQKDLLLKGAPDRVLQKCKSFMSFDGEQNMTDGDRKAIEHQVENMQSQGLRVLAIAEIQNAGNLSDVNDSNKNQMLKDLDKYNFFE
jgi:Ca2+-transporting ATPase